MRDKDITSVSNEAFTSLVLLENSYNCWIDIMRKNKWKEPPRKRGVKSNKDHPSVSNVETKYTSGGIFYNNHGEARAKPMKSWSAEGIN